MARAGVTEDRLGQVEQFERTVSRAAERLAYGGVRPDREDRPQVIERALANTITTDVPGLIGVVEGPDVIEQIVAQRSVDLAFIEALQTGELAIGGKPWVAEPAPPPAFPGPVTGEKVDVPSATVSVDGDFVTPDVIAFATDYSMQAILANRAACVAYVAGVVTSWTAAHIIATLDAAASTAADADAALDAVIGAGYPPDVVIAPPGRYTTSTSPAGVQVVPAMTQALYVLARSGLTCLVGDLQLLERDLPSSGDHEVGYMRGVVVQAAAGSVAKIVPA